MLALLFELSIAGWFLLGLAVLCFFGSITSYRSGDFGSPRKLSSFAWLIGVVVLLAIAFKGPVRDFVLELQAAPDWVGYAKVFTKWAAAWIVCGLVTAFFYWISFVRDIRKVFDANVAILKERLSEVPFKVTGVEVKEDDSVGPASDADLVSLRARALRSVTRALAVGANRFKGVVGIQPIFGRNYEMKLASLIDGEASSGNGYERDLVQVAWDNSKLDKLDASVAAVIPPRVKNFKGEVTYAAIVWPMTAVSLVLADLVRHVIDYFIEVWHTFLDKVSKLAWGKEEAF